MIAVLRLLFLVCLHQLSVPLAGPHGQPSVAAEMPAHAASHAWVLQVRLMCAPWQCPVSPVRPRPTGDLSWHVSDCSELCQAVGLDW
jgi:hypothetical protein